MNNSFVLVVNVYVHVYYACICVYEFVQALHVS